MATYKFVQGNVTNKAKNKNKKYGNVHSVDKNTGIEEVAYLKLLERCEDASDSGNDQETDTKKQLPPETEEK